MDSLVGQVCFLKCDNWVNARPIRVTGETPYGLLYDELYVDPFDRKCHPTARRSFRPWVKIEAIELREGIEVAE